MFLNKITCVKKNSRAMLEPNVLASDKQVMTNHIFFLIESTSCKPPGTFIHHSGCVDTVVDNS